MRKLTITTVIFLAAGMLLPDNTHAQQTPAAGNAQSPTATAQTAPAAGTQKASAAKTAQTTKPKTAAPPLVLKTEKDKVSYAIGMNVGTGVAASLHKQSLEVNQAILLRAMKDALAGSKMLMTEEEERTVLTQVTADARKKMEEKIKLAGEANKKEGEEFLGANKAKEGVVTLPSGLQYKILTEGTGPKPVPGDSVTCNYRGTLINGIEFDSSYKRGQPATFPVNGVIKGWTEALQLMSVGSKWQLFIPSELAYGAQNKSAEIGPNSTLIFEVELLSIQSKDKTQTPAPTDPAKP